jgi:pilus assembly protein CpaB
MARISSGTMTVVIFAILVGLAGAFVVRQEIAKSKMPDLGPPPVRPQPILVPVAAMPLEPGQTLALNDIALLPFSPDEFAKSKYAKMTFMSNTTQILGRTLKMGLQKDEVFLPEFLYPEGLGPGISDRIQAGYRAVTVPIKNVGAVQGFARPGTWVDVIFRSLEKGRRPEKTFTLLERVEVLAINESLMANRQVDVQGEATVTLAVTPHQVRYLKAVEGRGELSLSLRHADDTLDMAPFNIGQFDPTPGTISLAAGVIPVSHANDAKVDRADRTGANDNTSLDGIVGDSSEHVTLDDLLGFGQEPEKRQMEIYLGATRSVVEFDQPADDLQPSFTPTGRIRTPIAHGPAPATTRPAGQFRRTTTTQQPAFISRDRS